MQRILYQDIFSPSDLSNHLYCNHLTQLNLLVLNGDLEKPQYYDPDTEILRQRGLAFEHAYLKHLQSLGLNILHNTISEEPVSFDQVKQAMHDGIDVIYQARLKIGNWNGIADFIIRKEIPSTLGEWSYEVYDTKLAKITKAGSVLQLCFYSEAIGQIQGILPENMYVVTPQDENFVPKTYRVLDYMAYYRLMKNQFRDAIDKQPETYPEPVSHCDVCRWWQQCNAQRRSDDHLSLVAGISKLQRIELTKWEVKTLEALAILPIPLKQKPERGSKESIERVREQARVQLESRIMQKPVSEMLAYVEGFGLDRLPEPSPGDVFLDFEGDPFVGNAGLEYLTGWIEIYMETPVYHAIWATNPKEEKAAFEKFLDRVTELWQLYPDLHIYHFGHYEPSALKRMMSRYVTREKELDRLLRGKRFVNLHSVLKHTLRAGVEKYSLKDMEVFYDFKRETDLRDAGLHRHLIERSLEMDTKEPLPDDAKAITQSYNQEDCLSAYFMRNWFESLREKGIEEKIPYQRPPLLSGEESEKQAEKNESTAALFESLTREIDPDINTQTQEAKSRWLIANMLDYHWREDKASLWEYYRIRECSEDELVDEKEGLGHLSFQNREVHEEKYVIDLYFFPLQDCELNEGDKVESRDGNFRGEINRINSDQGWVAIKVGTKYRDLKPSSAIKSNEFFSKAVIQNSIRRMATWISQNGVNLPGPYRAGRDLLLKLNPTSYEQFQEISNDNLIDTAIRWSLVLQNSCLPIQGPPGSGKTFTASHLIVALLQAGKKVGVTALSHSVIDSLLSKTIDVANEKRVEVKCGKKVSAKNSVPPDGITEYTDNGILQRHLSENRLNLVGGTVYLWSREEFFESVDYLIVDEAGQLSLADTIAGSQAGKNLVLLGDPQQLKQPQKAKHPEGVDVSALEHLLDGHQTIPPGKGLFIDQSRRMHPAICSYISELFYEGKLDSLPGLEKQLLDGSAIAGAGLYYKPVLHAGNQNSSQEEAGVIQDIIRVLIDGQTRWTDGDGKTRTLQLDDFLIITPYNAQVSMIAMQLPNARVGTVDKFQGKEAPIVIYSMASSSPEDAPRGMEFLYSLNSLNVAISRAKTTAILVASPLLFRPDCRIPEQMRLANAMCRFLELSQSIPNII